jgi:hypothetical protein
VHINIRLSAEVSRFRNVHRTAPDPLHSLAFMVPIAPSHPRDVSDVARAAQRQLSGVQMQVLGNGESDLHGSWSEIDSRCQPRLWRDR